MAQDKRSHGIQSCDFDTSKKTLKGRILRNHDLAGANKQFDRAIPESNFENFMEIGVDRRTIVQDFFKAEQYSSMVKLVMTFLIGGELIEYQGTGQIVNLNLGPGAVSKPYIQTAAHNFVM